MQVIYGDASNIYLTAQKRLIRVVYGQTQATPYAAVLDPNYRSTTGEITGLASNATKPFKRKAAVFTERNSVVPGTVLVKSEGEYVGIATGQLGEKPFGLLGQWVGGVFDNIKSSNQVSAWQGFDAVIDILKPGFNETPVSSKIGSATISAEIASAKSKAESAATLQSEEESRLVAAADENGLLSVGTYFKVVTTEKYVPVAEVVSLVNANVLRIKLLI